MAEKVVDKFRKEVALQYAADNKIDGITSDMTDKALQRVIRDFVGKQEFVCSKKNGGCVFPNGDVVPVQDDDKYCWRCGFDCSADSKGGYDNLFGGKKGKQVNTIDNTGEDESRGKKKKDAKKDDKKDAKKDAKKDTKTTDVATTAPPEPEAPAIPLDKRVSEIKLLDASTGSAAWKIGQHFVEILATEQFREGKYKDVEKFLKKELDMSRNTMQMYIRVAERFEEEEASQLSVFKLEVIGRAKDTKVRAKLLKAAIGGMDRKQLTAKLAEAKEAEGEGEETRGRPKKSKFAWAVRTKKKATKKKGEEQFYVCLDGKEIGKAEKVWLEIDIDGDEITVEFAQFEE